MAPRERVENARGDLVDLRVALWLVHGRVPGARHDQIAGEVHGNDVGHRAVLSFECAKQAFASLKMYARIRTKCALVGEFSSVKTGGH